MYAVIRYNNYDNERYVTVFDSEEKAKKALREKWELYMEIEKEAMAESADPVDVDESFCDETIAVAQFASLDMEFFQVVEAQKGE